MKLPCALSLVVIAACAGAPARPTTVEPPVNDRPAPQPVIIELELAEIPYEPEGYGVRFTTEKPSTDCGPPVQVTPRTFEAALAHDGRERCLQRVSGQRKLTTLIKRVLTTKGVAVIDARGPHLGSLSATTQALYHRLIELGLPEERIRIEAKVGPDETSLTRVHSR